MRPIRSSTQVREHADHDGGERRDHARTIERPRPRHAETDGERPLPRGRIGRDVSEVVRHEDRHGEEPEDGPAPPGRGRHPLRPSRTRSRTSPSTRRRGRPSPRRGRAPRTDAGRRCTRTPPPTRARPRTRIRTGSVTNASASPAKPAAPIATSAATSTALGEAAPDRDETRGAEAARRVDAADPVEEVVRVVHAHLEAQRDDQGGHEPPRDERVRSRGADEHRHHSRAERPGARAGDPDVHGRFGNLEKSGRRFSTYASRPSCASSPM